MVVMFEHREMTFILGASEIVIFDVRDKSPPTADCSTQQFPLQPR